MNVGSGGDVSSPHATLGPIVASGKTLHILSIEAGTEGDSSENGPLGPPSRTGRSMYRGPLSKLDCLILLLLAIKPQWQETGLQLVWWLLDAVFLTQVLRLTS